MVFILRCVVQLVVGGLVGCWLSMASADFESSPIANSSASSTSANISGTAGSMSGGAQSLGLHVMLASPDRIVDGPTIHAAVELQPILPKVITAPPPSRSSMLC